MIQFNENITMLEKYNIILSEILNECLVLELSMSETIKELAKFVDHGDFVNPFDFVEAWLNKELSQRQ